MAKWPEPPDHLSNRSKGLWKELVGTRAASPGRLTMFQTALEALDRADHAWKQLEKEGLITKTKTTGAVHVHPLVKVERENRALFARLWEKLGFEWDHEIDSRLRSRNR